VSESPTSSASAAYAPPPRTERTGTVTLSPDGHDLHYEAAAEFVVVREGDQPIAEVFTVTYTARTDGLRRRPLTFVFNGGPGAASAYLHLGALGPKRVAFTDDGSTPPAPADLVDNHETWLPFTDLVFIDPVGTGLSRALPDPGGKPDEKAGSRKPGALQDHERPFYAIDRDLDVLCEVVQRTLTRLNRWTSPVYVAGESYGGYRAARLARRLQEAFGVGLNGVALISPALEIPLLQASDYDLPNWLATLPSMAAAAAWHGRSRAWRKGDDLAIRLPEAERFAANQLAPLLVLGDATPVDQADATLSALADLLGLPLARVRALGGRVSIMAFCRELLQDSHRVCGLYDASMTALDPFPSREKGEGPDPSLAAIDRLFTAGANAWLRAGLGVSSERGYVLLNRQVNEAWRQDVERHVFDGVVGATDDLRYGMALNPHLKVLLSHGRYDLVTPYFGSHMVLNQARLDPALRKNLHIRHFEGGHMFYSWASSRRAFRDAGRELVEAGLKGSGD